MKLAGAATTAALVLAAASSGVAAAAPASAGHWRISDVSHLQIGQFTDVAPVSPRNVWAVGLAIKEGDPGATRPIVEHWRGSSWSAVQLPSQERHASLTAVAASSGSDVWVFGYIYHAASVTTFALRREGGSWTLRKTWKNSEPLI